jgi:CO/xanthine dehydrogenase Mo-binding subunit
MGASGALTEEVVLNANGVTVNPNLHDYKISTTLDAPEIEVGLVEAAQPDGPFGAKGVGEPALAATAPAIGNAIFAATGIRIKDLPITPEKILKALQDKERT